MCPQPRDGPASAARTEGWPSPLRAADRTPHATRHSVTGLTRRTRTRLLQANTQPDSEQDKGPEQTFPPKQHPCGRQHTRPAPAPGVWATPSSRTGRGHPTLSRTAPSRKHRRYPHECPQQGRAETETLGHRGRERKGAAAAGNRPAAPGTRAAVPGRSSGFSAGSAPRGRKRVSEARLQACVQGRALLKS